VAPFNCETGLTVGAAVSGCNLDSFLTGQKPSLVCARTPTVSKKLPTVWQAEPHTIAKITILRQYLHAWFRILGKTIKNQTILFVDGFAGPGSYTNYAEGSPLAALHTAQSAVADLGANFFAKEVRCAFIEKDPKRFEVLCSSLDVEPKSSKIGVSRFQGEFEAGIKEVREKIPGPFHGQGALFVFADPFGGTGIPFTAFASCMEGQAAELLINLDADGIGRIFQANNPNREEQLTGLFGDESWRSALDASAPLAHLSLAILNLYKRRLRSLPSVNYVWSFAMRNNNDQISYHLVFASKHPLGLEKMKEAMRVIDQTGTYSFSDAHVDQHRLFVEDNEAHYAELLWQEFNGRNVPYADVRLYALNETPFLNAKAMLRYLENHCKVEAKIFAGLTRKKGDFSDDKVAWLRFGQFGSTGIQSTFL
jgi:three-Cys-motif partner protein